MELPSTCRSPLASVAAVFDERQVRSLLEAVEPANIALDASGWTVRLGSDWPQMLATLWECGEMTATTSNPCAALTRRGGYPRVETSGHSARSTDGQLDIELVRWHEAALALQKTARGHAAEIRFADDAGHVVHRAGLTARSDFATFVDWIASHQAAEPPVPPGLSTLRHRWETVQKRHWLDFDEVDEVDPHVLGPMLEVAMETSVPITAVVGNECIVHSVELTPRHLTADRAILTVGDEHGALLLEPERIDSVLIHHLSSASGTPGFPVLKCFDAAGCLCLAIAPPVGITLLCWNAFFRSALPTDLNL